MAGVTTVPAVPTGDELRATRESLHRAAEHLLSAARKRATGEITLVPGPGGVRTPPLPDGTLVALEGAEVVVQGPDGERRAPLTTLGEAAAAVGLEAGFPWSKHPPGTPFEPDAPLHVEPGAAAALAGWLAIGEAVLTRFAAEIPEEGPSEPLLFPEHFDLGITAGRVNYGFSPGDDVSPEPYVYVGPHDPPPEGEFWNAPFGAFRTWTETPDVDTALAFLRAGRAALGR